MRYWERRLPNMTRIVANDPADAAALLYERKVDVAVMNALEAMAAQAHDAGITAMPLGNQPYVIALRRDNPILLSRLNQILADMRRDGTLQSIISRWSSR